MGEGRYPESCLINSYHVLPAIKIINPAQYALRLTSEYAAEFFRM